MKRVFTCLLLMVIVFQILPITGDAAEAEMILFDDGSYILVEIMDNYARASGSKTGSKQYTYYDASNTAQWKVVLTGSFTYTGSSATCTSSSVNVTIYDSSWYVASKSASKSGNKAKASVTMADKIDGVIVSTVPVNISLACDANSNLS